MKSILQSSLAAIVCAGTTTGLACAGVTYNWTVNGFGNYEITYTITCSDGSVIRGSESGFVGGGSGSRSCSDGSNSLSWEFGWFWNHRVEAVDRKRRVSAARCGHSSGGEARFEPGRFQYSNGQMFAELDGMHGEIAVILDQDGRLPPREQPMMLQEMIAAGMIQPSQVVHHDQFFGPGSEPFSPPLPVPPSASQNQILVLGWFTTGGGGGGCTVTCDVNADGSSDTGDIIDMADAIASGVSVPNPDACKDFNQDGAEDTSDIIDLADAIASGTCP